MANKSLTELTEYTGPVQGDEVILISKLIDEPARRGLYSSFNYTLSTLEQDISNVMYPKLSSDIIHCFEGLSGHISTVISSLEQLSNEMSALSNAASAAISAVISANDILSNFISSYNDQLCSFVSSYEGQISHLVPDVQKLKENAIMVSSFSQSEDFDILDNGIVVLRKELKIESFTTNPSEEVIGNVRNSLVFNWRTNKVPTYVKLGDVEFQSPSVISYISSFQNISSGTYPFTLYVSDGKQQMQSTTSFIFANEVYYGSDQLSNIFNGETINISRAHKKLQKRLSRTFINQFQANALENENIFYFVEHSVGNLQFGYGGFWGGFSKRSEPYDFENSAGYHSQYDVYVSDQKKLGQVIIDVKRI